MDQETKDALVVFAPVIIFIVIIGLLIFFENTEMDFNLDSFFIDATADAGVYGEITADSWFISIVNFFGWENSWASLIMGLAILIMLFAVIYEILEFTAFDGKYTKIAIALGISVIIAVSRGVTIIMSFFLALAGGSVVLATLVAIGIGISFFIVATFYKGKMHVFKAKGKAADAKAGYVRAAGAIGGLTDIDSASKKLSR